MVCDFRCSSRRLALALAAIVFALSATPAHAQTNLRWKFAAGDKLQYTLAQKITSVGITAGMEITTTSDVTMDLHWDIKSVDANGVADMTQTIDRVRFKMNAPLTAIEFESQAQAKPEEVVSSALTSLMGGLVKVPFSLKVTPQGEPKDFVVPEKVLKQIKSSPVAANLGPLFTAQGLEQLLTEVLIPFPAEPVAKGHRWERKLESKTQTIETQYTYIGPEAREGRELEMVTYTTKLTLPAAARVVIKTQKAEGKLAFDLAAGRIVDSSVEQSAEMEILVGDMKTTRKVSSSSSVKLVPGK